METNERKNRKRSIKKENTFKFWIIVLVISIIVLTFSIFLAIRYKDQREIYYSIKEELNKETEKLNSLQATLNSIKEEETYLEDLDNEISKLKQEVYKLTIDLENEILEGKTNYKIAYLTFDDGPYYLTHSVIDVLKEKRVKATFFTIGLNKDICFDNSYADCSIMYKKIVDNGHTIANHTYSHLIFNGLYSSVSSFITQVEKQEAMIKERTGATTNIVRFPGGSGTAGSLKYGIIEELRNRGYGWVDWSAQDGDGGSLSDTTTAWNNLYSTINESIEVVLFHDYNYTTYSILPGFIDWLESNNYLVLPLTYDSVKVNK